jgi:hypothetical protein
MHFHLHNIHTTLGNFYFILFWCIFLILYFNLSYMHTFHLYNIHPSLLWNFFILFYFGVSFWFYILIFLTCIHLICTTFIRYCYEIFCFLFYFCVSFLFYILFFLTYINTFHLHNIHPSLSARVSPGFFIACWFKENNFHVEARRDSNWALPYCMLKHFWATPHP